MRTIDKFSLCVNVHNYPCDTDTGNEDALDGFINRKTSIARSGQDKAHKLHAIHFDISLTSITRYPRLFARLLMKIISTGQSGMHSSQPLQRLSITWI